MKIVRTTSSTIGDLATALTVLSFSLLLPCVSAVWARGPKVLPSDGQEEDQFGASVALCPGFNESTNSENPFMVVGAAGRMSSVGGAYVYRLDVDTTEWTEEAILVPSVTSYATFFGLHVACQRDSEGERDIVVLSANLENVQGVESAGAVYVYERLDDNDDWTLVQRITAPDVELDASFGAAVAIDGDLLAISASRKNEDDMVDSGAVYMFERNRNAFGDTGEWEFVQKLTPPDMMQRHFFGWSVALSGSTVLVGAVGDSDNAPAAGAAYVFARGEEFFLQEKLLSPFGEQNDGFGFAVALDGDLAVVGALFNDNSGSVFSPTNSGTAFIFERFDDESWLVVAQLRQAVRRPGDQFGVSVGIQGKTVIVGARRDDRFVFGVGSAYIYQRRTAKRIWKNVGRISPSLDTRESSFGSAVAIAEELGVAVVGSFSDREQGVDSGSVHTYWDNGCSRLDFRCRMQSRPENDDEED